MTPAIKLDRSLTDWDLLYLLWTYEQSRHLPECDLQDLSYCLDCAGGVYWSREELRRRGINKWPSSWLEAEAS